MAGKQSGVEIPIEARVTGFEAAFMRIDGLAKKSADGIKSAYSTLGTVGAAVGIGVGLNSIVNALTSIGAKTIDGERSLNALTATLKATGQAAGLTSSQLEDLGAELQSSTVFDDDAIRKAETALLRFRTVQGDVFRDAMRLAPDLAASLGAELPEAAGMLGKALTDPENGLKALRAAGLSLSEQNKDLAARMIEVGNKAGAQRLILDELRKSIGGAAGADSAGLYGATQRLARSWDDLQKAMGGKLLSDNKGIIESTTGALERLNKMAKETKISFVELATSPGAFLKLNADILRATTGRETGTGRFASGKISGTTPEMLDAEAAAQKARDKELEDQNYIRQQAALKRRVQSVSAANASLLAETKSFIDRESALYDSGYARNEIATTEFFEQQRKAAQASTQAVLEGLGKQGQAIENLMNAPSTSVEERAGLLAQLQGIGAESDKARFELKTKNVEIDLKEVAAIRTLTDSYRDLEVQLAGMSGDAELAARTSFDFSNRDRFARIESEMRSNNPDARAAAEEAARRIEELRYETIQRGALTNAVQKYERSLNEVADAQARIDIAVQSGAITELEALRQTSELRAAKVGQLLEELEVARRVADAIAAPESRKQALDNIDAMKIRLEELASTGDLVARKFNDIGSSAFSNFLQDLTAGKPQDALKNLGNNLFQSLNRVVADNLSQKAFGKDGIFSGFGDTLSKLFGGKGIGLFDGTLKSGGEGGGIVEGSGLSDLLKSLVGSDSAAVTGAAALTTAGTTLTAAGTTMTAAGPVLSTAAAALSSAAAALTAAAGALGASGGGGSAGGFLSSLFGSTGGLNPADFAVGGQFGSIPAFAAGTPFVQKTGLALLHKGERVVTAADNRAGKYGRSGDTNVTVVQNIGMVTSTQTARQASKSALRSAVRARTRG